MNQPVIRCARHLRPGNRFKMGGSLYQIADRAHNSSAQGGLILWIFPIEDPSVTISMVVPHTTRFKIYPKAK